jgi:hypothetical protein
MEIYFEGFSFTMISGVFVLFINTIYLLTLLQLQTNADVVHIYFRRRVKKGDHFICNISKGLAMDMSSVGDMSSITKMSSQTSQAKVSVNFSSLQHSPSRFKKKVKEFNSRKTLF